MQLSGGGGQERNHFIGKQNHVARLPFLTNRLPTLPGTLSFFPLPQGTTQHRAAYCLMNLLQVPNYPGAPDLSLL